MSGLHARTGGAWTRIPGPGFPFSGTMVQPKASPGAESVTYRASLTGYGAKAVSLSDLFDYYVQPPFTNGSPDAGGSGFAQGAWDTYTVAVNDVAYPPGWTTLAFPTQRVATTEFTLAGDTLSIIAVNDDRVELHANVVAGVAQATFPVGTALAIFIDGVEASRAEAQQAESGLRVNYMGPILHTQAVSVRFFNATAGNLGIQAKVGLNPFSGGDAGSPRLVAMSQSSTQTPLAYSGTATAGSVYIRFGITQSGAAADWGIWRQVGASTAPYRQIAYKTLPTGVFSTIVIPLFDGTVSSRLLVGPFGHNTFSSSFAQWTYIRGKSPAMYATPGLQKLRWARKDGAWHPVTQMWGKRSGFWNEDSDSRLKPRRAYNLSAVNSGGSLIVSWEFEDNPVSGPVCDAFDVNVYSGHTGSAGALARSVTIPGPRAGGGAGPYSSGALAGLGASAVDIIVTSKIGASNFGRKDSEVLSFN